MVTDDELLAIAPMFIDVVETLSVAAPAACVTEILFDVVPGADRKIVPLRLEVVRLASAVATTVRFPFPDGGFRLSHD